MADDEDADDGVDGRELRRLDELGSDDRLLRGLLEAIVGRVRDDGESAD